MARAALGPPCPDLAHPTDMEVLVPPMPWMARRRPWAPAIPLHPFKNYSGPCYTLKSNLNNELQHESIFIGWLTKTPITKP